MTWLLVSLTLWSKGIKEGVVIETALPSDKACMQARDAYRAAGFNAWCRTRKLKRME